MPSWRQGLPALNVEIQQLMSDYNTAESLASSIAKKRDCVADSIIGKV
jgi:hypothetical protein